jgi:hypothetical protein
MKRPHALALVDPFQRISISRPPCRRCPLSGLVIFLALVSFVTSVNATIPLPASPDWETTDGGRVGTGLSIADLNGDGWVDFVVANGNDMARQPVTVWRNRGDGTYNLTPDWSSSDIDYHGHCDLADVDGDGVLDLAAAVYLGSGGFNTKGHVKLYRGLGDGTFTALPVWQSTDTFYCFSLAFGDINMDGRPDLACATGDDYYNHPERRRVYRNVAGVLETTPSWQSTETEFSLDVTWADFNGDGSLDLAFAGTSGPDRIYFSQGGSIQTTAGWSSTDASISANTAAAGDYDGDGWIDLAIADNNQLGGSGKFKIYRNVGGMLTTTPVWQSAWGGYGSHVSFIDVDEDGDLDLSTGAWWGPVRVYENVAGVIGATPAYSSTTGSVIENEVWEDVDNDGLQRGLIAEWQGNGARKLFYFQARPVRSILTMYVDNVPVNPQTLYLDRDDAWVVFPTAPAPGARIRATFVSSADVDMILSNWDDTEGEYLFRNLRNPSDAPGEFAFAPALLSVGPNPSDGPLHIYLTGAVGPMGAVGETENGLIEVFDASGRRLHSIRAMSESLIWDGRDRVGRRVPPGVYLVRWTPHGGSGAPLVSRIVRR